MKTNGWTTGNLRYALTFGLALAWVPSALSAQTPADGGLQPGDKVTVTVWQRTELSGDFTVAPDGSLNHPLYREVRVTGIPVAQVEERLRSFLSAYEANPQVLVQPFYKVTVTGPVMRPDIYDLPPGTTVAQAVGQAGGVMENGDREDVVVMRGTNELHFDLTKVEALQTPVQSGDQILVDEEGSFANRVLPVLQLGMTAAHFIIYSLDRND